MDYAGKVAIVTGGADGLGAAICRRLATEGAAGIVVADIQATAAKRLADEIGGLAVEVDVGDENAVARLVEATEDRFGQVNAVFSNAGIIRGAHPFAADETFEQLWKVHIMLIVYLVRHTFPGMARMPGYPYVVVDRSRTSLCDWDDATIESVAKEAAAEAAALLSREAWQNV